MPSSATVGSVPTQPYAANSQQAIAPAGEQIFSTHTIARLELWLAGREG